MTARSGWRPSPGAALLLLLGAGTAACLVRDAWLLGALLLGTAGLYAAARLPLRDVSAALRPGLWLAALLFAATLVLDGPTAATTATLRLGLVMALAGFVTLAIPFSATAAQIERALRWLCRMTPLGRLGVRPARLALAVALVLRLLPLLAERFEAVREAQRARGRERHPFAIAVPLLVGSLKMADELAAAIEARGFDPER